MQTAIVMGVGPEQGLGAQLCRRFAGFGLHVFVAGRTRTKLDKVVSLIEADGNRASAFFADATNEAEVASLFDEASHTGPLSVGIYNAGNNTPGRIIDMEAAYFENSWKIGCFGGFLFAREALKRMRGGGTLLFYRRQRIDARAGRIWRFQLIQGSVTYPGAGACKRIRPGKYPRRPRDRGWRNQR